MRVLIGCLLVHALLAEVIPWPWWVPNLTLVGLILAIGATPRRWLIYSLIAGMVSVVWVVRFPGPTLLGYLAVGWMIQALAKLWDASDARVQSLMVGLAALLFTGAALWLDMLWSLPLAGLLAIHVAITCATLPLARRFSEKGQRSHNHEKDQWSHKVTGSHVTGKSVHL